MEEHKHSHHSNPPMGVMHHDHHKMMIDDFKKRFYVTLIITIPVMLLSPMIPLEEITSQQKIVTTGAYYLLSELTKGEGEHHD